MTTFDSPTYAELLAQHRPAMPTNDAEHERLVKILEGMTGDNQTLSDAEELLVETLVTLVVAYEDRVCPMPVVPALDMLHYVVEEKGLRQADFVAEFGGSKAYVNQIFKGSRSITANVATKLAKVLKVTPETFLPELKASAIQRAPSSRITRSGARWKRRSAAAGKVKE